MSPDHLETRAFPARPHVEIAQLKGLDMEARSNEKISGSAQGAPKRRGSTINEFCRHYPIGRTKVYAELSSGRLRARKIGRRTVITEDDAEAWLSQLSVMGAAP